MAKSLEELIAERKKQLEKAKSTPQQPQQQLTSHIPASQPREYKEPRERKQKNEVIVIEIDWNAFKQHICQNHAISNGNGDELIIFNKFFKPYSKNNSSSLTSVGRENSLYEAIKRVFEKHADFVIKVTREKML